MSISLDIKTINKMFDRLSQAAKNKAGKKAINAGSKLMAKAIKKQIPSKQKSARKAIGHSFKRPRSGKFRNMVFAKAGAGAGMKKEKRAKLNLQQQVKRLAHNAGRTNKKRGVGIGVSNIHWLLAGTDKRYTGTKRVGGHKAGRKNKRVRTGKKYQYTGKMKKSGIVQRAQAAARASVTTIITETFKKEVMREAFRK